MDRADRIAKIMVTIVIGFGRFPNEMDLLEKANLMHHMSIVNNKTSRGINAYSASATS